MKGRPKLAKNQETVRLGYKASQITEQEIEDIVDELTRQGYAPKFANKSYVQRVIVEKALARPQTVVNWISRHADTTKADDLPANG